MKARSDLVLRKIAKENILIPVGEAAKEIHGLISLTESGRMLWEALKDECTAEDLEQMLLENFEVDAETAQKDVQEFIEKMQACHLLV